MVMEIMNRASLKDDWWTPVECDNGNRMLRFVDP